MFVNVLYGRPYCIVLYRNVLVKLRYDICRIWEHLLRITRQLNSRTAIIITTHYIEEARQADKVMR